MKNPGCFLGQKEQPKQAARLLVSGLLQQVQPTDRARRVFCEARCPDISPGESCRKGSYRAASGAQAGAAEVYEANSRSSFVPVSFARKGMCV